jgi:hypothetical protein
MNTFINALGAGYSANKILQYLSKSMPNLAPAIQRAQVAGYAADKILSFIGESVDKEETKHLSGPERQARNNFMKGQLVKKALSSAGAGLAMGMGNLGSNQPTNPAQATSSTNVTVNPAQSVAGSQAAVAANVNAQPQASANAVQTAGGPAPSVQQGLVQNLVNRAMPQNLKTTIPQSSQPLINPIQANEPSIAQVPESVQPKQNSNIVDRLWTNFEKGRDKGFDFESDAFLKVAKRMKSTGELRSKEDFQRFLEFFYAKKNEGKDLPTALKEASTEFDNLKLSAKPETKITEESEVRPIEKNATVIAPQGVGEVKEIRNGKAIVEVDGKRHAVNEDELESSPIPEKELSDLYDDLLRGIEGETGEDVSRMVQWAGYNPDTNTLQFLPHTGDMYTYDDISEEDAALLKDVLSVRKTSGSNFIGAWKKDSKSPIGAALSKLIRKLQAERGGKGQEYSANHGTIYSAYEPAIQAKKKKKKK